MSFLNPATHDFAFEVDPLGYGGDGTGFLKLSFEAGEIDFIVGTPLTAEPVMLRDVEGQPTLLETVPEIITKKVVHRGRSIKPRDIFDIAAAAEADASGIISALRSHRTAVARAMETISRLNPDFVAAAISQLMITDSYKATAATAIDRAMEALKAAS